MFDTTEIETVAENTPKDNMFERMKKAADAFNRFSIFDVGDLVEWKPGLKNKRADGPFVVVEVLREPVVDATRDGGSSYFREPLDIVLGHFDSDGDFMMYHYDSRRLQHAKY